MAPKIWFTTDLYRGGLGDFLAGALGVYTLCRQNGYEFDIYLPESNPLSVAFDVSTEKPLYSKQLIMDASLFDAAAIRRRLEREFRGFPFKVIAVSTNVQIATEDEIDIYIEDFLKILRPSKTVNDAVKAIQQQLGVESRRYSSIHIRCGDAFLAGSRLNPRDIRMTPRTAIDLVTKAADVIQGDIIVHTDSAAVRQGIIETEHLKVSPVTAKHVGEPLYGEDNGELEAYIHTVADFYVMCNADKIYANTESGFSRLAALVRGVYVTKLDLASLPKPVITEPVAEPIAEPISEPVAEPAAEPISEPVAEPAARPTNNQIMPPPRQKKKNKN